MIFAFLHYSTTIPCMQWPHRNHGHCATDAREAGRLADLSLSLSLSLSARSTQYISEGVEDRLEGGKEGGEGGGYLIAFLALSKGLRRGQLGISAWIAKWMKTQKGLICLGESCRRSTNVQLRSSDGTGVQNRTTDCFQAEVAVGIDRDHRVRPLMHDDWTRVSKTKQKRGSSVKRRDGSDFFVRGGVNMRGSVRTDSDSRCDYC